MNVSPANAIGRHPWLDEFAADPAGQFARLLAGRADIYPYTRADPVDAARMLFAGLGDEDPMRASLSSAAMDWLKAAYAIPVPTVAASQQNWIRQIADVFEIIASLGLLDAADGLRRQYIRWQPWVERMSVSPQRDSRAAYLRMLAGTQVGLASRFPNPDGLLPLWMRICVEAGSTLPDRYLQIGLVGLRKLPLAIQRGDTPWLAGLAEWALHREPSPAQFLAVWRPLKRLYPSSTHVLRKQVYSLLRQSAFRDAEIEPPGWWRFDSEFPQAQHNATVSFEPPALDLHENLLDAIAAGHPFSLIKPRLIQLIDAHRRYAARTGDPDYLIRTFCNVGQKLIQYGEEARKERVDYAELLARETLNHRPFDIYGWSLWRDAFAAGGAYEAARDLGWEIVRRFPNNSPARNLLAELMIAGGETAEAMRVVTHGIADGVADSASYVVLARLKSVESIENAKAVVLDGLAFAPGNPVLSRTLDQLRAGKKPSLKSGHFRLPQEKVVSVDLEPIEAEILRNGRLRALRERLTAGGDEDDDEALSRLRSILDEDPNFAYAQILAARHRIWRVEENALPPVAAAFEIALADEDRDRLERLALKAPRLVALVHLARAMFGDEESAEFVRRLLEQEDERSLVQGEKLIKARLSDVFRSIQSGIGPVEAIQADKLRVLHVLYDVNEALAAPEALAA